MMNKDYYAQFAHGSAELGSEYDAQSLANGAGPIGTLGDIVLRRRREEPTIVLGGAGSGKGANLGVYQIVHSSTRSFFLLDVSGQYMSLSWHWNLHEGRDAYAINVEGASSYADINHPVNLWGILKNDTYLFENARRIAGMALKENEKEGENLWVGAGARRWFTRILIGHVLLYGSAKPDEVWSFINRIDCDDEFLKDWGRATEHLPFDVYSTIVEIYRKKQTAEKEYGAIMGKIKDDLDWLSSPTVAQSISGDEDYLSYLADPKKLTGIYYTPKGGSGKIMESLTRMVVGIAMLHCMRASNGSRPLFYLEEAATVGGAPFIKTLVSECRKFIDTVLVYQSHGQPVHLFGKAGAQEIFESCGQQILLGGGIRDIDSARRYADTVGKATIYTNDPLIQADRAHKAKAALDQAMWKGGNLLEALDTYEHEIHQAQQQRQAGRYAIDPSELMRLTDQVLVLTPGLGLPALLANKLPRYFENPAMAGRYGPDPLFPPLDRVITRHRWWGQQYKAFIREDVPDHLAARPNHSNGQIAYVNGYKTW